MTRRETDKQKQEAKYMAALQRLKDGTARSKGLKTNKINRQNVEIEAGASIGSLRHYPNVVKAINSAVAEKNGDIAQGAGTPADRFKQKYESERDKRIKAERLKATYSEKAEAVEEAMKAQLAQHHELTFALFSKVPWELRSTAIDEFNTKVKHVDFSQKK